MILGEQALSTFMLEPFLGKFNHQGGNKQEATIVVSLGQNRPNCGTCISASNKDFSAAVVNPDIVIFGSKAFPCARVNFWRTVVKSTGIASHKLGYNNTGYSFHSINFTINKLSQNALAPHVRTIDLLTWAQLFKRDVKISNVNISNMPIFFVEKM